MSRTFRLKQKSYIIGTESEDGPGSLTNCVQHGGGTQILWEGSCDEEPNAQFFADMCIEMPDD